MLIYYSLADIYKICHAFLPYQKLEIRIRQTKSMIKAIETWLKDKHKQLDELVRKGYNRLYKGHLTRYRKMLDKIEKIKASYRAGL